MATGNGNFFSHGITFGATIEAEQIVPIFPSRAEDAIRFILFVDDNEVAITPEIIPAASGADVGEGRVAGLRYTLPSLAYIQSLEARIEALEALIETTNAGLKLKNTDGQTVIEIGADVGSPTLSFFGGSPQLQQGVVLSSPTLAEDTVGALQSYNIIGVTP